MAAPAFLFFDNGSNSTATIHFDRSTSFRRTYSKPIP